LDNRLFLLDLSTMANTSSPHEAYSSTLPADLTSSYLPDTSFITNSPQARNSFSPPAALGGGAYTGFSEAINSIPATWGMSDEGYILSRLNDEPTQHREYNLRPADPGVERMLEDFEKSEIEDWEFNMVHFHHVYGSQWREPYDEADQYDGFSNGTIMPLTVEEFRERLFDEALLEDFERYEKAEEEFWMMRGVAHMYGMWDEEYWQTQLHSPWRESTYHLGREEVEANSPLRAERWRDTWKPVEEDRVIKHQTHEVPWREQMRKHGENGTPSVISWPELPRCPSQCTEYRKLIHGEMSPGMSKATQCPVNCPKPSFHAMRKFLLTLLGTWRP